MITTSMSWPIVPRNDGATSHGGYLTCSIAEDAKNLWVRRWNIDFDTYNVRTLASESSLEMLFEELKGVIWYIIGLNEVLKTCAEFIELKNGHSFCDRGQTDKKNTELVS